ncbi:MAG TPA: WecB/TagA/CpsF family glycosyltransferase [Hyphomicrobiaceae bacterium]|nr:WecB/TagA/CpsF family glycosyltransferase [Hyphomicrobiaceae bacterium]
MSLAAVYLDRSSGTKAPVQQLPTSGRQDGPADRRVRVFGLEVTDTTLAGAAHWIIDRAMKGERAEVAFLNAHCVNVMYRNRAYRTALERSHQIFADGSGVRIAARAAGVHLRENVNGTDLLPVLCREAADAGAPIYFLGAREGIAAAAARRMQRETPGLIIAGHHHGYLSDPVDEAAAIDAINRSGAKILLVGLGVPSQELWIARNRHRLAAAVVVGVGGLFDYYSGRIPRAPLALRRFGFEWVWRLAMEPRRLANRYLVGNAEFLLRLAVMRALAPAEFQQS